MLKVPYGQTNKSIHLSRGGDSDMLKFYSTTNNVTYGRKWQNFEPRLVDKLPRENSGYTSNIRVPVYYNQQLDQIDNPNMLPIISDNYHSETNKKYKAYAYANGSEPIGNVHKSKESAFLYNQKLHTAGQTSQYSDSSSETHEKFQGRQLPRDVNANFARNGASGFTSNKSLEPLTFHPDEAYTRDTPAFLTDRPTGISITHSHYIPFELKTGNDLPIIANRSDKDSAYTRGADVNPPIVLINKPYEMGQFGPSTIGRKELGGAAHNNVRQVDVRGVDGNNYLTEYNYRYVDGGPRGEDREGHAWGEVLKPPEDGFTRSTKVHYN